MQVRPMTVCGLANESLKVNPARFSPHLHSISKELKKNGPFLFISIQFSLVFVPQLLFYLSVLFHSSSLLAGPDLLIA
ncbi:hypothetical protein FRX31_005077 [Thalictrum thalictroides]|uniref:Uncharacterized protein n=1 Tax=Thalictrum thalictroides TaxID=46969 RepID=A0A7J6X6D7_THATH|nr:hypothetical protein FRX31_005077 [Thalictrum thalictroides]